MRSSTLKKIEIASLIAMALTGLLAAAMAWRTTQIRHVELYRYEWGGAVCFAFAAYGFWTIAIWCRKDRRDLEDRGRADD